MRAESGWWVGAGAEVGFEDADSRVLIRSSAECKSLVSRDLKRVTKETENTKTCNILPI